MGEPGTRQPNIFFTWLPLAFMWVMMAIEQPIIVAVVARMNEATRQLAAFGVTFSLALFIEGPVIQMLAASTAVADGRENYRRLITLMHIIGWSATVVHGILCLPDIFESFAQRVMRIPEQLVDPARLALLSMIPWTLGVGYRRLWQGLLIRCGRTRVIPVIMVVRISVSFATLWWGFTTETLPGAVLGGLALSAGVVAGAVTAWIYARPVIRALPPTGEKRGGGHSPVMTWWAIIAFYTPLALTNFINLGARPVMQMGMARGEFPLESLAIWPVSMGYLFLYSSFSLSSQEVVIARLEGPDSRRNLIRFNSGLAIVLTVIYLVVITTPLWRFWFAGVSGLSEDLVALSLSPIILIFPVVPLSALISLFRGALVRQKRTREVTYGVGINVGVLFTLLFIGVALLPSPAISVMSAAYAAAFIAECLFLAGRRPLEAYRR